MRWIPRFFFALGALPLLVGCPSLADVAMERCRGIYPLGSAAYGSCWHREYERQMRVFDDQAAWRRYEEWKGGY